MKPAARVAQLQPFTVEVAVTNLGARPTTASLRSHATFASPRRSSSSVALGAGETLVIEWPLRAASAGRPYIVSFELDGDRSTLVDATGEIVSRAPVPRPATPER